MLSQELTDSFGRRFAYLRLSITEACNFRCSYCLPRGYEKIGDHDFLTCNEILRAVSAFAKLGVWKIRLTGGEPTIRSDFLAIARAVASVSGVKRLSLTTNGYKLTDRAKEYRDAGIKAINVSIDSMNDDKFRFITGHDRLAEILDGVDLCLSMGFEAVKINTVLLNTVNNQEIESFLSFVKDRKISLRFIELMRTNDNADYFNAHHISGVTVQKILERNGWFLKERELGAGPALEYAHPDYQGTVGLIMPYSQDFCQSCNRLRVSACGNLHLCLFGEGGYSLRPLLQSDDQREDLIKQIINLMSFKTSGHKLNEGQSGATRHLAMIGG